jgi:hypothetical protein
VKRAALLLVPLAVLWVAAARGFGLAASIAVATAAVAAGLASATVSRGVRAGPEVIWLAGLVGWCALDAGIRPVSLGSAAWFVAAGMVAVLLAVVAATPRGASWGRLAVIAAGCASAGWMVVERAILGGRPAGPFDNPNPAATVALLGVAVTPALRASPRVRLAVGSVLLAGVLASGSRGALLAAVALAAVWALSGAPRGLRRIALALVALAVLGLSVRLVLDRDPLRFERIRIWAVAARTVVAELPWGSGPGGFRDAALAHNFPRVGEFAHYARTVGVAESDVLELAASLGLPGIVLGLGLATAVLRRLRPKDTQGWGVVVALVVTSAVNTQLAVPVVAWVATLAVGGALPRGRGPRLRATPALAVAAGLALCAPLAMALRWPSGGMAPDPGSLLARCQPTLERRGADDRALADAEATVWEAAGLRPRDPLGWRVLGALELRRAVLRRESALAEAAAKAFARARADNRLDAWAALGEGQARRMLGDLGAAKSDIRQALEIEPNFVAAWLELAVASVESGELDAARRALALAETAEVRARSSTPVSSYEIDLARADPVMLARLRATLGARP